MKSYPWDELLKEFTLPAAIVDLDAFDRNTQRIREKASQHKKTVRVASKSLRVPFLMKRIQESDPHCFRGLLTYSVRESVFLYRQGFRDLVVAYPSAQDHDIQEALSLLRSDPSALTFMIDSPDHIAFLAQSAKNSDLKSTIPVCIDFDMSYRPLGIHLGVQRSPIRNQEQFDRLLDQIKHEPTIQVRGLMGYEAQIAGLADSNPFAPLLNPIKRAIKQLSIADVRRKRGSLVERARARGVPIEFVNGGGTGSLNSTLQEESVTEVTAGSGFLQSHLFDYYQTNSQEPALFIALRATRRPEKSIITCHGGGIIGSGEIGPEKAMIPFHPPGLSLLPTEGCGEVQTPLKVSPNTSIKIGDPILFRPAKSGEPLERFKEVYLVSKGRIVNRVPTYRGFDQEFQ